LYIHSSVPSGITSSHVNDKYLFYSTTYTGINYACISGINDINDNINYSSHVYNFASYPNITANHTKYIHCNNNYIICCTLSGIDCYDITTTSGYRYYTTFSGAQKCFVLNNDAYYTTQSGNYESVVIIKDITNNWDTPYKIYDNTGLNTFEYNIKIKDLFVKYGEDYNTIYCATSSGVYEVNEDTGAANIYNIENNNMFTSVCVSSSGIVMTATHDLYEVYNTNIIDTKAFSSYINDSDAM
jgi:hypothetical protein